MMQINLAFGELLINQETHSEKRCYTVSDIMSILNVGRKAVYGLIRQKKFPAIRIYNAGYQIPKDAFHAWLYQLKQ